MKRRTFPMVAGTFEKLSRSRGVIGKAPDPFRIISLLAFALSLASGCAVESTVTENIETSQLSSTARELGPAGRADASAYREYDQVVQDPQITRVILRRTAAIIHAFVRERRYDYSEDLGPRSVFRVQVLGVLAGKLSDAEIELPVFGGPTGEGRAVSTSLDPKLEVGVQYVLFLRNSAWYFTPVVATALRIERALDRQVLVDRNGYPLVELTPTGLHFRDDSLFLPRNQSRARELDTARMPAALAGVVDLAAFTALLADAIAAENVAPSGVVQLQPRALGPDWRFFPTSKPQAVSPTPSLPPTAEAPGGSIVEPSAPR